MCVEKVLARPCGEVTRRGRGAGERSASRPRSSDDEALEAAPPFIRVWKLFRCLGMLYMCVCLGKMFYVVTYYCVV